MSNPVQPINSVIHSLRRLVPIKDRLIIACSGGADSMALLFCAIQAGYKVEVGHVVHDMRPVEDTAKDRKIVEDLCKSASIPFHVRSANIKKYAEEDLELYKGNLEDAYRTEREKQIESIWCNAEMNLDNRNIYVATGHHADDQLETILMKLCRGTGLRGMSGISEKTCRHGVFYVRPMLSITKVDTYAICKENKIPYVEDTTNNDTAYTRNAIRHKVLPVLKELFPHCSEQFTSAGKAIENAQKLVLNSLKPLEQYETIVSDSEYDAFVVYRSISIKIEALRLADDIVIFEWLRRAYHHAYGTFRGDISGCINKTMCNQVIQAIRDKKAKKFNWPNNIYVRVNQTEVVVSEEKRSSLELS